MYWWVLYGQTQKLDSKQEEIWRNLCFAVV